MADMIRCIDYRKEMFLFNDALNTFHLRLYDVRHMVNDHSDSERGNPLSPHGRLFPNNSKLFFYMHHPTDRITHNTVFVAPVVAHWLEREIAQSVHPMKDRPDDPSHYERTLLPWSYISLLIIRGLSHKTIGHVTYSRGLPLKGCQSRDIPGGLPHGIYQFYQAGLVNKHGRGYWNI